MSPAPVRVLVVDDQRLIRDGISSVLAVQEGIEVVGTAADGAQAVAAVAQLRPDVLLMDVRMPEMDGVTATGIIQRDHPAVRVLMLTTFDDEAYVLDAIRAGACGYLLKDLPAADLARTIRLAAAGIDQYDPAATRRLASALDRLQAAVPPSVGSPVPPLPGSSGPALPGSSGLALGGVSTSDPGSTPAPETFPELTRREAEVLRLVAGGATNREIAETLFLSEGTVKNHVSSILSRLGLRGRTQAALQARENGWI